MKNRLIVAVLAYLCLPLTGAAETSPQWIWSSDQRKKDQTATLRQEFSIDQKITSAQLQIAADFTRCRVIANQATLLDLDAYAPWTSLDVTDRLVLGNNTIRLQCRSTEGPAAVAVLLRVRHVDGSEATFATNDQWIANRSARAKSLGNVSPFLWDDSAEITAFDNYEQWRQVSGVKKGTNPATFATLPGFSVDLVRTATDEEGSWVSMAIDKQGRLIVARESSGLLRMTLSNDGSDVEKVELINDSLLEIRGILIAHNSIYVNANNSKGMYRLRDTNGDDQFDDVQLLREFPGSVGHGRNDLAIDSQGRIYSIHGDAVNMPDTDIVDYTSPYRVHRKGGDSYEGHLIRTNEDGTKWELLAAGLRNPYGIDFNADGELFTYDADHEFDMGSAWYRPTRFNQLNSGGDYGWRRVPSGKWPPYFPDSPSNALPTADVGKGSPTSVKSGSRSSFPQHYRRAMFALDWAYGRILACHLVPRGAGYACRVEEFLKGRPLNVTDLDFDSRGDMYLVTGGRKTQSTLYRVRFTGAHHSSEEPSLQARQREKFSKQSRAINRSLAKFQQESSQEAINPIWKHLGDDDPLIRQTARVALEHQPVEHWRHRALSESDPEIAITALMALARSNTEPKKIIMERLNQIQTDQLSSYGKLSLIQSYRRCITGTDRFDVATEKRLLNWFERFTPNHAGQYVPPLGSGEDVYRELARLVADQKISGVVRGLINLLSASNTQRERMHALYLLCSQTEGWNADRRRFFFEALQELEQTAFSGEGMSGRLKQIREKALESMTEQQKSELGKLVIAASVNSRDSLSISRPHVRNWTVDDAINQVGSLKQPGDPERGERLYREVQCVACHRMNGPGGLIGPDLTAVASRFSRSDILSAIISPSDVIAEKYQGTQIVTVQGKVLQGRIALGGDYRATSVRLIEDPFEPGKITDIPKSDIELHQASRISPMPAGLLDTMTAEEINDLLAYLESNPH